MYTSDVSLVFIHLVLYSCVYSKPSKGLHLSSYWMGRDRIKPLITHGNIDVVNELQVTSDGKNWAGPSLLKVNSRRENRKTRKRGTGNGWKMPPSIARLHTSQKEICLATLLIAAAACRYISGGDQPFIMFTKKV